MTDALPSDTESTEALEGDPQPDEASRLGARVRRGSLISIGQYAIAQILRLATNLILTRLLFQEVFGLMALIQVLIVGLHLFSDVGIGPSIVQNEKGDQPEFLDTAFTVQLFRGVSLWLLCCVAAYPFASFYDEPRLLHLLPVAGLTAVLAGLQSTKFWTYQRDLRLGKIAVLDIITQVTSATLMLVLAYVLRSVWALIISGLINDALRTLLTHVMLEGHRNRIRVHRASLVSMIRFGRWIFFSTVVSFCVSQTDRLVFGKLASLEVLATYSIAVVLASMPSAALWHLTGTVLLPAYSRIVQSKGALSSEDFLRVRGPLLLAAAWVLSGMIAGGAIAIDLLYDDRYADAGWMVQMLSVGAWFMVVDATIAPSLMALGQSQWMAAGNLAKLIGMAVLIPIGFHLFEFPGAIGGYAMTEVLRYALSTTIAHRRNLSPLGQDLRATGMLIVGAAVGWFAGHGAGRVTDIVFLQALAVFAAVTVVFLPVAKPALRRFRAARAGVGA
ncbi:MAG: oligosaccharide flippase family protein [Myxococcota bacterium]|nr:oligosaccharide flippase family protein [Myxococcota bacterium]